MLEKRWLLSAPDSALLADLSAELGLNSLVVQVLLNRGLKTKKEIQPFLAGNLEETPDPFLMRGMETAVERIRRALNDEEGIVVYGDYDVDGQTATALLVSVFRKLAKRPELIAYYLPQRLEEGYGLHSSSITQLAAKASLLITVDCGISSVEEIALGKKLGLDVIVSDHHEPGPTLPPAVAILNPKQPGCSYPDKNLAGVGVAFKLVQALGLKKTEYRSYLDLVALGTVADLVPLQGENRIWVQHGLQQMAGTEHMGLRALMEVANVKDPTAGDVGFRLGPRLNAVGRLGDPRLGVELLLTSEPETARTLALELHLQNSHRQDLENEVLAEALEVVEGERLYEQGAIVVWGADWHSGVIGIVASRLVERYYRPTIVISLEEGEGTASARSISGFHLYEGLALCGHLLKQFGGHAMAAGFRICEKDLEEFRHCLVDLCNRSLSEEDLKPKLHLDGLVSLGQITEGLVEQLALLEPHGIGNRGPVFQTNVSLQRTRRVGRDNRHLQAVLQDETAAEVEAIGFSFGEEQEELERHAENVSLAFSPEINVWQNRRRLQLQIKAWKEGPREKGYVQQWMVDNYPWRLPGGYSFSRAWEEEDLPLKGEKRGKTLDLRGSWNKGKVLQERRSSGERTLILVNTARQVLEVCRQLRIQIPGGRKFISFEHEWLSPEEREEWARLDQSWLVSTGYGGDLGTWPAVWLWKPPLNQANFRRWTTFLEEGGQLVLAYGPRDVRELQVYLGEVYPDRAGLARIYTQLRASGESLGLQEAQNQLEKMGMGRGLPFAAGVFSELGLWEVDKKQLTFKPAPAEKLDVYGTVLYNKGTTRRQESDLYLKGCLERGFFQDGFKREN